MRYTINEIANLLDGKVIGNSNISINNIQKIEVAQKGDISFIANSKYLKHLSLTKASAVIIDNNYNYDGIDNTTLIVVNDAYLSLAKLIQKFDKKQNIKNIISDKSEIGNNLKSGDNLSVGSFTKIGDNVKVGDNVTIMNNCSIGDDVIISDNTIIYPSVNIYHSCEIGINNIIHSGAVIGADGFGFAANNDSFNKINQIGNVITGDHVEISIPANSGDILNRLSISFSIPENLSEYNTSTDGNLLVDQFGISIFEYIDLYIGDQLLNRITSDDINIYNVTRAPSTHALTNDCIQGVKFRPVTTIGSTVPGSSERIFLTSPYWVNGQSRRTDEAYYRGTNNTTQLNLAFRNYIVDLPFYFHDRPKHGFPLCSIRHQELKIRIKLRDGKEVVFPVKSTIGAVESEWDYENDSNTKNFPLSNFKLNMDVIHLDKAERIKFRSLCKDILIEQNQHNTFTMGRGITTENYRLNLKNCVKELYFIVKKKYQIFTTEEINTLNAYQSTPGLRAVFQKPVPCIYMRQKYVTLTCDGLTILDDTTGSHQFLSACIPDVHHKQTPYESNLTMYSFALHPDNIEPSGNVNFSMIKDIIIQIA